MNEKPGVDIKCLAVIRSASENKVKTTICDLLRYANLTFAYQPRKCDPTLADNVLIHVMKEPLRECCKSSAIVPITNEPIEAIGRLRKIHPPAHVIIVGPRHEIYHDLINYIDILPELDLTLDNISFCGDKKDAKGAKA